MEFLERAFRLKANNANVKTEIAAGITTFMTMAYILIVNPSLLSAAGMDAQALFTATALSSAAATIVMAFIANLPFALAPGMGLNAFFAFTVCGIMGYSWQEALAAVFVEGIIFIVLSVLNVREAIFNAIPQSLKQAVSVGIGLFIAFIGLQNAGIIVNNDATLVSLSPLSDIGPILALIGTAVTAFLVIKKVKGALLWGIIGTYVIGLICQLLGLYNGISLIPSGIVSLPPSVAPIAFKFDFSRFLSLEFFVIVFSFLFVDIFDTIGTLIGVSSKAGFLDRDGKLPKVKEALLADAVGTTFGAMVGTSTVTTYVESAAGVAEGGKTGLTAFTTGILFLVALFFAPVFLVIPSFATAPALIIVGLFMLESVVKINFSDYTEGFPAFVTIIMMPFAYSISEGLVFGTLSFVLIKMLSGKNKDLNPAIVIIAAMFLLKLIFS